jgi:hypothetical protein
LPVRREEAVVAVCSFRREAVEGEAAAYTEFRSLLLLSVVDVKFAAILTAF